MFDSNENEKRKTPVIGRDLWRRENVVNSAIEAAVNKDLSQCPSYRDSILMIDDPKILGNELLVTSCIANSLNDTFKAEAPLPDIHIPLKSITLTNCQRTKSDFIEKQPFIEDAFKADSFYKTLENSSILKEKLMQLDIFSKIESTTIDYRGKPDEGFHIKYKVQEVNRARGKGTLTISSNDNSIAPLASIQLPNIFGRGESASIEYARSSKASNSYSVRFQKPIGVRYQSMLNAGLFRSFQPNCYSSFNQLDHGAFAESTFETHLGVHSLRYDCVWREVKCPSIETPIEIRKQAGHSLKSAISHSLVHDTRDNPVLATHGSLIKFTQEIAGGHFGGDTHHLKGSLELKRNFSLPLDMVLELSTQLISIHALKNVVQITDALFLGGPMTVRGFDQNGIGPLKKEFALGATSSASSGVHVYSPLPFIRRIPGSFADLFRLHLFVNSGTLFDMPKNTEPKELLKVFWRETRASVGAGVLLTLGAVVRIEVNACWPLRKMDGDKFCDRFQYGVGLQFL